MVKNFNFFHFSLILVFTYYILGFIDDQTSYVLITNFDPLWSFYEKFMYIFSLLLLFKVYWIYCCCFFAIIAMFVYFFYTTIKYLICLIIVNGMKNTVLMLSKDKTFKENLFETFIIFLLAVFFGYLLNIVSFIFPLSELEHLLIIVIPILLVKLYEYFSSK